MENGHLLQAQDVLALPGEKVTLRIRFESGTFLRDEKNRTLRITMDGKTYAVVATDREGFAETSFVPPAADDYRFGVEVMDTPEGAAWPGASLLVCCRSADAPLLVVDLDGTVMEADFEKVLTGDPQPLPDAPAVLGQLGRNYTIVYLTHRPELFGPKSKDWLARHGFPPGPVLLSDLMAFARGSRRYKTDRLHDIRSQFTGRAFGVGDQISDARAYRENGISPILLYHVYDANNPDSLKEQAEKLGKQPENTEVVCDWRQVREFMVEGRHFPPARRKEELLRQAAMLKPR